MFLFFETNWDSFGFFRVVWKRCRSLRLLMLFFCVLGCFAECFWRFNLFQVVSGWGCFSQTCFCWLSQIGKSCFLLCGLISLSCFKRWCFTSCRLCCIVVCCFGLCSVEQGCEKLVWICFPTLMEFAEFRVCQNVSTCFCLCRLCCFSWQCSVALVVFGSDGVVVCYLQIFQIVEGCWVCFRFIWLTRVARGCFKVVLNCFTWLCALSKTFGGVSVRFRFFVQIVGSFRLFRCFR